MVVDVIWCHMEWYCTVLCGIVLCARFGMDSVVWYVIWYGVIWNGTVWYCVV